MTDVHDEVNRWAADQLRRQGDDLDAARRAAREQGLGDLATEDELALRRSYAHQWRDKKSQYERELRELRHSESPIHRRYRQAFGRRWPANPETDRLARITRQWDDLR